MGKVVINNLNDLFALIRRIYAEAKEVAESYEYSDVLLNEGKLQREIMDEYARQVNKTSKYRYQEQRLQKSLSLLQDSLNAPASVEKGKTTIKQIETYMDSIKTLLKVYQTIGQIQANIIKYYERGGATF